MDVEAWEDVAQSEEKDCVEARAEMEETEEAR